MMTNVNYARWTDYIESLFDKYDCKPRQILDLACGTCALTIRLARNGYEMTGVDRAVGMLDIAKDKAKAHDVTIEPPSRRYARFPVKPTF